MQKFKFPMKYLRVTQGEFDIYSHAGSMAMDFGGRDTGSDKLYCPCDMRVMRARTDATSNGELYLESLEPVLFADGTSDYARLILIHDNYFNDNIKVGNIIKQDEYFYDEGGKGGGKVGVFGTHVHIEGGKGKWKSTTQFKNSAGSYVIENQAHLYDLFIVPEDVVVLETGGYNWKIDRIVKEVVKEDQIFGLDLSNNNKAVNLKNLNGKAKFIMLRAAIGSSSPDPHLDQFLSELPSDMPIGFYAANYFGSVPDAEAEADYLVKVIKDRGLKTDFPLFCDWEGFSYNYWSGKGIYFTSADVQNMAEAFCERIKSHGYKVGVYTNKNYWDNMFSQKFFDKHPDYYIWYARPGYDKPDRGCYMWQYDSNNAIEFGINATLDKDVLMEENKKMIISEQPIKMCIGFATGGDIASISALIDSLGISKEVDDGFIYTSEMTAGDQATVIAECERLGIAYKQWQPIIITEEAGNIVEEEPGVNIKEPSIEVEKPVEEEHIPLFRMIIRWILEILFK